MDVSVVECVCVVAGVCASVGIVVGCRCVCWCCSWVRVGLGVGECM